MQLKILSWNIWIEGHFNQIRDFLQSADADIIGLQEVNDTDPNLDIIGYLRGLGYHHIFAPIRKTWGDNVYHDGPALFSKYPIVSSKTHLLSEENTRAAIQADIQVGDRLLHVFCTHLLHTHQEPSEIQTIQIENLIKVLPEENTILMGDFNAIPDSSIIQKVKKIMTDADSDSLPTWSVYPEGCSKCNPQTIETRLDYIFVSQDLKTKFFNVGRSKGSDHLPISVMIGM